MIVVECRTFWLAYYIVSGCNELVRLFVDFSESLMAALQGYEKKLSAVEKIAFIADAKDGELLGKALQEAEGHR